MALSKTLTKTLDGFAGQVQATNVYYKVEQVSGNKDRVAFTMRGYKDGTQVDSFNGEFVAIEWWKLHPTGVSARKNVARVCWRS